MSENQEPAKGELVRSTERALAVRTSSLVDRGLRDIASLDLNRKRPEGASYGANNKIVTREMYEAARAEIRDFTDNPNCALSAGALHLLIERTRFAASTHSITHEVADKQIRYALDSILFEKTANKLSLIATDGHRLARSTDDITDYAGKDGAVIVPIGSINLIERLLSITDPEQDVFLTFKENKLFLHVLSTVAGDPANVTTGPIEGVFPPYEDNIPKDSNKKATINRDHFFSAVRRAALLATEATGIRLAFSAGTLAVWARDPEIGDARIDVPIEYAGEPIEIGFNPIYIMDALKVADTEQVTFEMKRPDKPGLLRYGPSSLCLIMPVNLSSRSL